MESPFVETQILTEHKWTWKIVTQNSISAIVVFHFPLPYETLYVGKK